MQRKLSLATLLMATALALALVGAASAVYAADDDWSQVDSAGLEQMFWDCDTRATQDALSPGDGALCSSLGDAMKNRLFDGDFERLLVWWRAHKATEYAQRGIAAPQPLAIDDDEAALQAP